jgi:predicted nucleic acid-binding protein
LELLVRPLRDGDEDLPQLYRLFLAEHLMLAMLEEVYDAALSLRVRHALKTPDALHLATNQYHGCTQFWTNDDRLATIAGGLALNVLAAEQPE